MAFIANARVRIANVSSQWRNNRMGTVKVVKAASQYDVLLDGHGCASRVEFAEDELQATGLASPIDYSRCA